MANSKDRGCNSRLKYFGRRAVFASERQKVFKKLNESFQQDMAAFKREEAILIRYGVSSKLQERAVTDDTY